MDELDQVKSAYINLAHRTDRDAAFRAELARVGLESTRVNGIMATAEQILAAPNFVGLGCWLSHERIIQAAIDRDDGEDLMVFEDDVVFCSDFQNRLSYIKSFLSKNEWDVFWLGGTWHHEPHWHAAGHPYMSECRCDLGVDWQPTDTPNIMRTYGCFCSYAYLLNINSAPRFLEMTRAGAPTAKALDWLWILMQPDLKTFAFSPGCCIQRDDVSDIRGFQRFSGFAKLGKHWFADKFRILP